jgi:hypothetical protein
LKNPDFSLFKNVQMRGAREIDERRRLLIRWSEAIEAQRSRWAFFNSLTGFDPNAGIVAFRERRDQICLTVSDALG